MQSFREVWQSALKIIENTIPSTSFHTWIVELEPAKLEADKAVFYARSSFQRDVVNNKFLPVIAKSVSDVMGFEVQAEILVADEAPASSGDRAAVIAPAAPSLIRQQMENELTFESFIVGNSNKFAHAASQAVAANPAFAYNPLFIYGGSGLGKTHLLYAIRHEIMQSYPAYKCVYIKGDDFTNELIESLRQGKTYEFRNKYRYADVLLVDDIQFIGGKEATQEEFFHTFNTLYEANKQIVLTSDRPPKEIQTLEDRLRSRFEMGLIADIQPPDFETRSAIIRGKAELFAIDMPDEVVEFLSIKLKDNIRQIEGVVKKIKAYHMLTGERVNIDSAQNAVRDILSDNVPIPVTIEKIIAEVGRYYNVSPAEIKGKRKTAEVAMARQVAMYLIHIITDISNSAVGKELGGKDPSTVHYAVQKINRDMKANPQFKDVVEGMMKTIQEK